MIPVRRDTSPVQAADHEDPVRTPSKRPALLAALALALVASACTGRNVAEIPEPDTPTPDETPIIEPVTPNPANEADDPTDDFPPDEEKPEVEE